MLWWAAVPPEALGLPAWVLDGLSVGSLVLFIVVGLGTSRLWTKSQVDGIRRDHEREMASTVDRYETHLKRTVELYQGRVDDALEREREWRDTARLWQRTAETLTDSLETVQEQSQTSLAILQAWQVQQRRSQ